MKLGDQVPADEVEPARPKGLNDHAPVVHLEEHVEDLGVEPRGQLDEKHVLAQGIPQRAGRGGLRRQGGGVQVEPLRVHHPHRGPVDALKGVKVLGPGLDRPTAQQHPSVEGQKDSRLAGGRHGKGQPQVLQRVGEGVVDGELGPGEDHRDANVL